jgi:hypothetical protein
MTTRFRDFGAGTASDAQPLSFKLHGEEFECIKEVQGKILLTLVADSSSEDPAKAASVIDKFFSAVLTDESYARFDTLLKSKEKIVAVDTLAEITGWLVQEYTDRPTERPEVS